MKKRLLLLALLVLTYGIFAFPACDDKTSNGEGGIQMEQSSGAVSTQNGNGNGSSSHSHNYVSRVTTPTCTAQGYTKYTCSCGDNYEGDYENPLGHSFANYISNNDATEEQDGTETATCDRNGCNAKDTRTDVGSTISKFIYEEYLNGYTIKAYSGDDTEVIVPSTYKNKPVVAIGYDWQNSYETPQQGGFVYCNKVEKVILPDTIKIIGYGAFAYSGIEKIEIPSSVERIVAYAFAYTDLKEFTIPNTVSSCGYYMFCGTPLKKLTIGARNGEIRYLFGVKENNTLEEVIIEGTGSIVSGFLRGLNKLKTVKVKTCDTFIGELFGKYYSTSLYLGDKFNNPYENNFTETYQDVKTGAWSYNSSIGYVYEWVSVPVYTFNGNRWFSDNPEEKLFLNGDYQITEQSQSFTAASGAWVSYKEPDSITGSFYYLPESLEEIQISSSCTTDVSTIIGDATYLKISYYD